MHPDNIKLYYKIVQDPFPPQMSIVVVLTPVGYHLTLIPPSCWILSQLQPTCSEEKLFEILLELLPFFRSDCMFKVQFDNKLSSNTLYWWLWSPIVIPDPNSVSIISVFPSQSYYSFCEEQRTMYIILLLIYLRFKFVLLV